MLQFLKNLPNFLLHIVVATLVAYYNLHEHGWFSLATNFYFLFLGTLLVSKWKNLKRNRSEVNLEQKPCDEMVIDVDSVGN